MSIAADFIENARQEIAETRRRASSFKIWGWLLKLGSMSTAVVSLYMHEGFVIAADGHEKSLADGSFKDEVPKIFSVEGRNKALAYAFSGAVDFPDPAGRMPVNKLYSAVAEIHKTAAGHSGTLQPLENSGESARP